MDPILLLKALILGIVEGLTEFLPISSTGHLILAGDLLNFNDDRGKLFEIVIQFGAILAVVWEYRQRLLVVARGALSDKAAQKFILNLFVAFLPLAILGLLFGKAIKANLFNPIAVASTFILGAFVILWAERREHTIRVQTVEEMSLLDALKMGIAQAFALIPGTSRSGRRSLVACCSACRARRRPSFPSSWPFRPSVRQRLTSCTRSGRCSISTMSACGRSDSSRLLSRRFLCVRWLLRFISSHDFTPFAWYRIVFGIVVLSTAHFGWVQWAAH